MLHLNNNTQNNTVAANQSIFSEEDEREFAKLRAEMNSPEGQKEFARMRAELDADINGDTIIDITPDSNDIIVSA